jgi:translation initiation factor IF-2
LAKNLKLNIKNTQIAQAVNLGGIKSKLAKAEAAETPTEKKPAIEVPQTMQQPPVKEEVPVEAPRIRARSKSSFVEPHGSDIANKAAPAEPTHPEVQTRAETAPKAKLKDDADIIRQKTSEELRKEIFGEEIKESSSTSTLFKKEEPKS